MNRALNKQVEKQLWHLQLALTQDTVWRTCTRLLRAASPFQALIGIRCYAGRPLLLRTTHPLPDGDAYLARLTELGMWWGNAKDPGPRTDVRRLSDIRCDATLRGWPYYEEFMRPNGWRYIAGLLFRSERGDFLGELNLYRTAEQGDFNTDEVALLRRLHPHIAAAVARLVRLDVKHSGREAMEMVLRKLPISVVIANWDGEVEFMNRSGSEVLHAWKVGLGDARALAPEIHPPLPAEIKEALRRLRRRYEAVIGENNLRSFAEIERVSHLAGTGFQAEISILPSDFRQAIHPSMIIRFHVPESQTSRGEITPERTATLTLAERAVAERAARGLSNDEIAKELAVSRNTVRTHLRSIFEKLSITSRGKLAALLRKPEAETMRPGMIPRSSVVFAI